MTHQLEELRDFLWRTGMFDKLDHDDHIALAGFIAQHDAELLGEILKQKRTIGTGELFDECEVVDVSVIEQYQHKQGTDREDA